jgi:hypothetical protein
MADGGGFASSYLPALSRLMGEVEQPTDARSMMSPQFGGSPEQLMGILQHPQTQALLGQLGIHFDPSTIKQSPFLPQQFMQHHPMLGGMMNSAMANVAATPEAPLVSGAGSGMSRAMQGMMGGPELLRQYQIKQMLSPMQAMGSMIPGQEFQRKQELMRLLEKMETDRAGQAAAREKYLEQSPAGRLQNEIYAPPGAPGYFSREQAQPAGGAQGLDLQQTGQRPPLIPPSGPMAGQAQGMPDYGQAPATAGGPQFHPYDIGQVQKFTEAAHPERQRMADWRQAMIDAGIPDNTADKLLAQAEEARAKAGTAGSKQGGKDQAYWEQRYQNLEEKTSDKIRLLEAYLAMPDDKVSAEQKAVYQQQIDQLNQQREQEKAKIDAARGQAGASTPYLPEKRYKPKDGQTAPQVSPGASPGGAQAGGQGSQKSEGTATAPNQAPKPYDF